MEFQGVGWIRSAKDFHLDMDWVAIGFIVWVDLHRTHGISEHVATLGSSSGHALSDNN